MEPEHYLQLRRAMECTALRIADRHSTALEQVAATHCLRDMDRFVQEDREEVSDVQVPMADRGTR